MTDASGDVRVLLVDDQPLLRTGFRMILEVRDILARMQSMQRAGAVTMRARVYQEYYMPVLALARLVVVLDRDVVDAYVRGAALTARWSGRGGQRVHDRERAASGLAWVVAGVVAVALAGVALW